MRKGNRRAHPYSELLQSQPQLSSQNGCMDRQVYPRFNDPEVLARTGWWPYLTITNTSFDEVACGEGSSYKVSPTDEDIDTYMPIKSFKP